MVWEVWSCLAPDGERQGVQEQRAHSEMEWKLQRTARRKLRTDEEMLWVRTILFFLDPTLPRGFLQKVRFVIPSKDQKTP